MEKYHNVEKENNKRVMVDMIKNLSKKLRKFNI